MKLLAPLVLCVSLLLAPAPAGEISGAKIAYRLTGTAGLVIDGTAPTVTESETAETVTFVAPLAGATTGIAVRDKHMRKYLEVDRFPDASLTLPRADLHCSDGTVRGTLTLHGQEKVAVVAYRATARPGDRCRVKGTFDVDLHAHGIDVPAYLGIHIDRSVSITVELEVSDAIALAK